MRPQPDMELTPSLVLQQQILSDLRGLSGAVSGLTIKLFGDATVENERGRFPLLEKTVERLEQQLKDRLDEIEGRVDAMEKQLLRYTAMATVIGAVGSAIIYALFHYFVR